MKQKLEKSVKSHIHRLYVHLSEHNLLFEKQFCFWAGKSTEHTTGEIMDRLLDSLDQNF